MSDVVIVIGAGSIGVAIARRVSAGKHVLLADLDLENAQAAAEVMADAGFETELFTGTVVMFRRAGFTITAHHASGRPIARLRGS